jgi:hypothetical protein
LVEDNLGISGGRRLTAMAYDKKHDVLIVGCSEGTTNAEIWRLTNPFTP